MKTDQKRKVLILLGSQNDLPQCLDGLEYLNNHVHEVQVLGIHTISKEKQIRELLQAFNNNSVLIDVIIVGAGCATTLPATVDEVLSDELKNTTTCVIGVALEDIRDSTNSGAARRSLSHFPHYSSRMVYQDRQGIFFGYYGFKKACEYAMEGKLPEIELGNTPHCGVKFSLDEAISQAKALKAALPKAKYRG